MMSRVEQKMLEAQTLFQEAQTMFQTKKDLKILKIKTDDYDGEYLKIFLPPKNLSKRNLGIRGIVLCLKFLCFFW